MIKNVHNSLMKKAYKMKTKSYKINITEVDKPREQKTTDIEQIIK